MLSSRPLSDGVNWFLSILQEEALSESILTPFSIKDGMSLAKAPREALQSTSEFDQLVAAQSADFTLNYIQTCKLMSRKIIPKKNQAADDSVIIMSDPPKKRLPKFKLLQFNENHRPAYYGTWQQARGSITPRNPLKKNEV